MKKDALVDAALKRSEKEQAKIWGGGKLSDELRDLYRTKTYSSVLKWILLAGVSICVVSAMTGTSWVAMLAVFLLCPLALLSYAERRLSLKTKQLLEQIADQGEREAEVKLKIEPSAIDASPNIKRNP